MRSARRFAADALFVCGCVLFVAAPWVRTSYMSCVLVLLAGAALIAASGRWIPLRVRLFRTRRFARRWSVHAG